MAATTTTTETFPMATIAKADVEADRDLRIKAGAIRSAVTDDGQNWILTTEWNVIGENDP